MLTLRTEKLPPTTTSRRLEAAIIRFGLPLDPTIKQQWNYPPAEVRSILDPFDLLLRLSNLHITLTTQ